MSIYTRFKGLVCAHTYVDPYICKTKQNMYEGGGFKGNVCTSYACVCILTLDTFQRQVLCSSSAKYQFVSCDGTRAAFNNPWQNTETSAHGKGLFRNKIGDILWPNHISLWFATRKHTVFHVFRFAVVTYTVVWHWFSWPVARLFRRDRWELRSRPLRRYTCRLWRFWGEKWPHSRTCLLVRLEFANRGHLV